MTRLIHQARAEFGGRRVAVELLGGALCLAIVGLVLAGWAVVL